MAKTNTRKYIIYGSIATIVGVLAYYIWKSSKKDEKPKDETPAPDNDGKEKDGKVNENKGKGDGGGATVTPPTQAETDLATAYRKWANSTDWKIKTYGATSKYKLDETNSPPYNTNFTDSYSVGKTDYDAFLKGNSAEATQIATNKKNMDALIEAWYGNSAAKKYSDTGSTLMISFEPSGGQFDKHYWAIQFYGNTNGKSATTYAIFDGALKQIGTGYWLFTKGGGYKITPASGKGTKGQLYRGFDLNSILTKILDKNFIWWKK